MIKGTCAENDFNKVFGISVFCLVYKKEGITMRRKIGVLILVGAMCVISACSSGEGGNNEPDIKPETTETTVGDAIGQDAEIQMTTTEEESSSEITEDTSTSEVETTTEEQTTTQPPTTTAQPTTPPSTTTQETTTKKQVATAPIETVNQETTTNSAMVGSNRGAVTLDITPSAEATKRAQHIVADIINYSMSDYECVKAIHDYLVKNIDYGFVGLKDDTGSDLAHRAEGALCYDTAVCQGYAEAFELLCAQVGIQAHMMYGEAIAADGIQSHAWNVVKVNGEWYQIDCTWDDPLVNGNVVKNGTNITYKYFLLTDTEMYIDHILDKSYSKDAKVCTSTLFKGVGERMSLEIAMGEPSMIVTKASSFYSAVQKYISEKVLDFYIAVPATQAIDQNSLVKAVENGLNTSGLTGQYGFSYTSMNVVSYVVYHITISK